MKHTNNELINTINACVLSFLNNAQYDATRTHNDASLTLTRRDINTSIVCRYDDAHDAYNATIHVIARVEIRDENEHAIVHATFDVDDNVRASLIHATYMFDDRINVIDDYQREI
jgi:hypothetical protein